MDDTLRASISRWEDMPIDQIEKRIARLEALRQKRIREAAELEPKPVHGSTLPVVITFKKVFTGRKEYNYAGIRTPLGTWSITGKTTLNCVNWETVVAFIRSDESHPDWALNTIRRWCPEDFLAEAEARGRNAAMDELGDELGAPNVMTEGYAPYDSLNEYGH